MTEAPFQAHFLTTLGLKKPGQVSSNHEVASELVVSGSDTPPILGAADEVFNLVRPPIEVLGGKHASRYLGEISD